MKKLFAATLLLSSPLLAAPDTVDPVFAASAGHLFDPLAGGGVSSVLVQPDGKILFGSNEMPGDFGGTTRSTALTRFNPDGTVDSYFFADNQANGSDSGIYYDGIGWPETHALGLQSDGKIIAAGVMQGVRDGTKAAPSVEFPSNSIVRFNADGTIDTSFQTNGTAPSTNLNFIEDVTIAPDDKIYAVGGFGGFRDLATDPYTTRYGIARLNANGSLDTTFQVDPAEFGVPAGVTSLSGFFREAAVDPSGKIYIAGSFQYGPGFPQTTIPVIARVFPDGSLDTSFTAAVPNDTSAISGIELEPDGRLVVLGYRDLYQTQGFVVRLEPDGSLDPSFTLDPSLTRVTARPLQRDAAGRYLLTTPNTTGDAPLGVLVRITSTGAIDPTFRAEGSGTGTSFFNTFTTGANGKIYAGTGSNTEVNGVETIKLVSFEGDSLPPTLAWTSTRITPAESNGSVILSITRSGDLSAPASVTFATTSGSATGSDFTATSGALTWPAGVGGVKTFTVTLLDDAIPESDETFTATLSGATGASVASPSAITVTIRDDDSPPSIITQPAALTVKEGEPATFSVAVSSPIPPTFRWQKNGSDIPGATASVYSIPATNITDDADYSVIVSGTVPSATAHLTVIPPAAAIDPTFSYSGITEPENLNFLSDGSVLLLDGNAFTNVTLRKLSSSFVVDPSFIVTTTPESGFNASSAFPSPIPLANDQFLATGFFSEINGVARRRLARLNADGGVDLSFIPFFNSGSFPINSFTGFFNGLSGVRVADSGAIYAMVRSSNQGNRLFRMLSDGSADPDFSIDFNYSTNANLSSLLELSDGSILIGYTAGGFGGFERGLRKVLPNGTFDPDFARFNTSNNVTHIVLLGDDRFAAIHGNQLTIHELADGALLETHTFTGTLTSMAFYRGRLLLTGPTEFNGLALPGLALFSLDGTVDDNFPGGAGPNGIVGQAVIDSQERIVVSGDFTTWNGSPAPSLTRLLVDRPELGFATNALTISENGGPASISVVRYGDTSVAASVRVTTTSGTATATDDFAALDETVTWAAGDASPKTVTLTLVDDTDLEGDETLTLQLSDSTGGTIIPADLTVTLRDDDSLPQITAEPAETFAVLGKPATLTIGATSPTALSYQWFLNGGLIPDATTASYSIPSVSASDEGTYTVRLTNDYDFIVSAPAELVIIPDPTALAAEFIAPTQLNSSVYALAPTPDNGVYVGGAFQNVNGEPDRDFLVRLDANGVLDTNFTPPTLNNQVIDLALQPDGKIIAVGQFTSVGGSSNRRIIRLETDGSLDPTFTANVSTGPNGDVLTVALEPDGSILIGGSFSSYGATDLGSGDDLIRLNPDGTLADKVYFDFTTQILDLLVLPDGDILASYNTTSSSAVKVRRFNHDLTLDNSLTYSLGRTKVERMSLASSGNFLFAGPNGLFEVDSSGTIVTTFPNTGYFALARQMNGKVLAGGSNGARLFRYLPDGVADPTFTLSANPSGTIQAIALRDDGKIWVGGFYATINGTTVNHLALLNGDPIPIAFTKEPSGTTVAEPGSDVTFTSTAVGTSAISYQWKKGTEILSDGDGISGITTATLSLTGVDAADAGEYSVVITNDSGTRTSTTATLVVLGAPQILSLSEDASLLEGTALTLTVEVSGASPLSYRWFRGTTELTDQTTATLSIPSASEADAGSYTVEVSNSFDTINGGPILVEVIPNPAAIAPGFTPPTITGTVRQVYPLPDGKALIGGDFTSASDGVNTSGARLAVVNPDGSIEPVSGLSADGSVYAIRDGGDGKILLAGQFNTINGQTRRRVARLNPNFSLDLEFDASTGFGDFSGLAQDVGREASGTILLVGQFTDFNGDTTADYAVRLTSTGAHDTSFTSGAASWITRVLPQPDGKAVFIGWFGPWAGTGSSYVARTEANGSSDGTIYPVGFLVGGDGFNLGGGEIIATSAFNGTSYRLSATGAVDSTFLSQGIPNGTLTGLAQDAAGRILLGGNFTTIAGASRSRIARILPNGTRDDDFGIGTGLNGAVEDIQVASDGSIWIGGAFTDYNGTPVQRLVRLKGESSAPADPFTTFVADLPEGLRGESDDPDGDGFANLIEFIFGTDPGSSSAAPAAISSGTPQTGAALNASYALALDPAKTYRLIEIEIPVDLMGASVTLEASEDLSFSGDAIATEVGTPTPNGATETRRYVITPAIEDAATMFWRLSATR